MKSEVGRQAASSRETNHKSLAGSELCTVVRTVDASVYVCCEIT
jgi:hypothetical protein